MRKSWPLLAILLLAACGPATPLANTVTSTPPPAAEASETSTLPPTSTVTLPALTATPVLFEGTLSIKVNVRAGPGTTYASLGLLEAGAKVQILNKDKSSSWIQILYPSAPQGRGWIAAQYVQVPAGTQIPLDVTPTPSGPTGVVTQRLNVRSGPATTYDSLGTLEAHTQVALTGKNSTASWFQIQYPSAPAGLGWVTAQYIQTEAVGLLPVLDDYGTPIAATSAGTPSGPFQTPTPTVGPAFTDGDSQSNPAVQMTLSPSGTRQFTYSSQVSAPEGDLQDWVAFTPFASTGTQAALLLSLTCQGNDTLTVELWQNGAALSGLGSLACGDVQKPLTLMSGQPYEFRLSAGPGEGLRLVDYSLTVASKP